MSLQRYLSTNREAEADQSSLENDRTPASTHASNVTTAPYNLSGRDSVKQPESSLTNTIGIAEKSKVAITNYSKHLSVSLPNSQLCEFC